MIRAVICYAIIFAFALLYASHWHFCIMPPVIARPATCKGDPRGLVGTDWLFPRGR